MPRNEDVEDLQVYVMRQKDRNEWLAKARGGDDLAALCWLAAVNWMKGLATEHCVCSCCDMVFSGGDVPHAFIVLIPAKYDPETVMADAGGVCSECSKHDDKWLVDQGVRRQGLSPTEARPGDQVH
jgi:hypothetical protein